MTSGLLPDADARARIARDLDQSLVVVAGAGTGKTTALVERLLALVRHHGASLREVAVITFTEAAAAELRVRVRRAIEDARAASGGDPLLDAARHQVDEAAICTVHAFARRMLEEHAVSAGLPPGFDVVDEVAEQADFESGLTDAVDRLLDDPAAEPMLLRGFALGLGRREIAEAAWCLHSHWDRLADGGIERIDAARPAADAWPQLDVGPIVAALDAAMAFAGACTEPDDRLLAHLTGRMADARAVLAATAGDEQAALPLLARLPTLSCRLGQQDNWGGAIADVRAACTAAEAAREAALDDVRHPVVAELLARLARDALDDARRRAGEGRLTFHDLLVHARRLLRDDAAARGALRRRYRWLLVDEFQDTDPLQVELAGWLASAVEGEGALGGARPGALCVVGDPKQSIYRFRRADIGLFSRVCAELGGELVLRANFRSVPGILRFVNTVFAELFGAEPEQLQADHHPLDSVRDPHPAGVRPGAGIQLQLAGMGPSDATPPTLDLPPVVVLGGPVDGSAGEVRRAAARDVAAAVRRAVTEGWPVSDPADDAAPSRPARWGDVAVVFPARTSLPALEEALEDAGVPYRLEGAALLWGSDDVRDVLCTLAAADEPSDAVSVLAALRSPGLACGDDDLLVWHRGGGSWDPRAEVPEGLETHPVARAMAVLADLHRRRWWTEPSALVGAAMVELRSFELAFAHRRPRDHWNRLRWLADQARCFDEAQGGTMRDFLRWAELQCAGDGRAPALGPPEADDDAVRLMTVHGAKGLEFPVTVVAGLETEPGTRADAVRWTAEGAPEVRAGPTLRSAGYVEAAAHERALDRLERDRLLYVAMTRARDHLVLCLHHKARNGSSLGLDTAGSASPAARLAEICRVNPLLWRRVPAAEDETAVVRRRAGAGARRSAAMARAALRMSAGRADDWDAMSARFTAERAALVERLRALPVVTAGALHARGLDAGGLDAGGLDAGEEHVAGLDGGEEQVGGERSPSWSAPRGTLRGRGGDANGIAVGRAVHDALAALDFRTGRDTAGRDAAELARSLSTVHGIADRAGAVGAMVGAALTSDAVLRAAERRHHKEMYVSMPLGDGHGVGHSGGGASAGRTAGGGASAGRTAGGGAPDGGAPDGGAPDGGAGVFEGFVDLVVEDDDGLVVVDYKTDRVSSSHGLAALVKQYRLQVAAYAAMLEAATGRPVARCVLLFLGGDAVREHVLQGEELAEACAASLATATQLAGVTG